MVVRQDITRKKKAMGKRLPLFTNEGGIRDYRFSTWITNSKEEPYEVWTMCKPRANDENTTIKELKEDVALGRLLHEKVLRCRSSYGLKSPRL